MNDMPAKAIIPYYGGKMNMAEHIIAQLGPHKIYWEPFCGALSVLMYKKPAARETVNDLYGDLINLARVIQDDHLGPMLYRQSRRIMAHEDIYRKAVEELTAYPEWNGNLSVERAMNFLLVSWLGFQGHQGTTHLPTPNFPVHWTGGTRGKFWTRTVRSIPVWRRRLQGVTILRRDGLSIIENVKDKQNSAMYVDPPYLIKSNKYVHDFDNNDHLRLAKLLRKFKRMRVVVSYYDDPHLTKMYPGWTKINMPVQKCMFAASAKSIIIAPEVFLVNGRDFINKPRGFLDMTKGKQK